MKMLSIMLLISSFSSYAQWDEMVKRQAPGSKPSTSTTGTSTTSGTTKTSAVNTKCEDANLKINKSLPRYYVQALLQGDPKELVFEPNTSTGNLKVTTGGFVDNCAPMLKWTMTPKVIDKKKVYAMALEFADSSSCKIEGGKRVCFYTMNKLEDGRVVEKEVWLEPTFSGLEECLVQTGVWDSVKTKKLVDNGKGIITTQQIGTFSGVTESGDVVLESVGKELSATPPLYNNGAFVHEEGCSKYEQIADTNIRILSQADYASSELEKKRKALLKCKDADLITQFLEQNNNMFSNELLPVLEKLIIPGVKKSIAAINKGKYTDDDIKMIETFDRYIIQPKIKEARLLMQDLDEVEGDKERKEIVADLNKITASLATYQKSPYITTALIEKLESKGDFDAATSVYGIKTNLFVHSKLGKGGDRYDIDTADEKYDALKEKYAAALPDKKDKYLAVTGQLEDSRAEMYNDMAHNLRKDIEDRTENFQFSASVEAACMSHPQDQTSNQRCMQAFGQSCDKYCKSNGGRYCYGTFVFNKQRCIQDGQYAIQGLQEDLQHFNQVDHERSQEYGEQSDQWYKLESKGRRYLAGLNGEKYVEKDWRRQYRSDDGDQRNAFAQGSQNPGYQQNMFQQQQNPYGQYMQGGNQSQYGAFGGQGNQMGNQYAYGNNQFNYGQNQQYNQFGNSAFGSNGQMNGQFGGQFNTGFNGQASFGAPNYYQNGMYNGANQNQMGQGNFGAFGGGNTNMGYQQGQNNMGYWNNPAQAYNNNYNMGSQGQYGNYGAFGGGR